MTYKIETIEGIGPAFSERLVAAMIQTTDDLLRRCKYPSDRKQVARETGISEGQLLRWSNMADLLRIRGIGPQYAELLEASGVDTIRELRYRSAENLATKMEQINTRRRLTRKPPAATRVRRWIDQAASMRPRIYF